MAINWLTSIRDKCTAILLVGAPYIRSLLFLWIELTLVAGFALFWATIGYIAFYWIVVPTPLHQYTMYFNYTDATIAGNALRDSFGGPSVFPNGLSTPTLVTQHLESLHRSHDRSMNQHLLQAHLMQSQRQTDQALRRMKQLVHSEVDSLPRIIDESVRRQLHPISEHLSRTTGQLTALASTLQKQFRERSVPVSKTHTTSDEANSVNDQTRFAKATTDEPLAASTAHKLTDMYVDPDGKIRTTIGDHYVQDVPSHVSGNTKLNVPIPDAASENTANPLKSAKSRPILGIDPQDWYDNQEVQEMSHTFGHPNNFEDSVNDFDTSSSSQQDTTWFRKFADKLLGTKKSTDDSSVPPFNTHEGATWMNPSTEIELLDTALKRIHDMRYTLAMRQLPHTTVRILSAREGWQPTREYEASYFEEGEVTRILARGQSYEFHVHLVLPNSVRNLESGMFMISMQLLAGDDEVLATCDRPLRIPHEPIVLRWLRLGVGIVPYLLGIWTDDVTLHINCFKGYTERFAQPVTSVRATISNPNVEVHHAVLDVRAQLSWLAYLLHDWYIATACIFIIATAFFLFLFTCSALILWFGAATFIPENLLRLLKGESNTEISTRRPVHLAVHTTTPAVALQQPNLQMADESSQTGAGSQPNVGERRRRSQIQILQSRTPFRSPHEALETPHAALNSSPSTPTGTRGIRKPDTPTVASRTLAVSTFDATHVAYSSAAGAFISAESPTIEVRRHGNQSTPSVAFISAESPTIEVRRHGNQSTPSGHTNRSSPSMCYSSSQEGADRSYTSQVASTDLTEVDDVDPIIDATVTSPFESNSTQSAPLMTNS